jgi:hypothetical protein
MSGHHIIFQSLGVSRVIEPYFTAHVRYSARIPYSLRWITQVVPRVLL